MQSIPNEQFKQIEFRERFVYYKSFNSQLSIHFLNRDEILDNV